MRSANLARQRGFCAAERGLREQLASAMSTLDQQLNFERELLKAHHVSPKFASPLDIYQDLVALFDEFPLVAWCTREKTLFATTESIQLEGIELGAFEIRLNWDSLDNSYCYETIAVDRNPAASDHSITHPHVQDGRLCEGESHSTITRALAEGRLLDFFLIVRCMLTTYNSLSAYIPLSRWDGVHCDGCGGMASEEQLHSCRCGAQQVCDECGTRCAGCGEYVCERCGSRCRECDDNPCCENCETRCCGCGSLICSNCQTEGRCDNCVHEQKEAAGDAATETVPLAPDAAV